MTEVESGNAANHAPPVIANSAARHERRGEAILSSLQHTTYDCFGHFSRASKNDLAMTGGSMMRRLKRHISLCYSKKYYQDSIKIIILTQNLLLNEPKIMKQYAVYIMTNTYNHVLYTGVTGDLLNRILQHKEKVNPKSFTARYQINKLVYYEYFQWIQHAIEREKQIKAGSRKRKLKLIEEFNPTWKDLYEDLPPY